MELRIKPGLMYERKNNVQNIKINIATKLKRAFAWMKKTCITNDPYLMAINENLSQVTLF